MSELITWPPIGGASFSVPDAEDENWSSLTDYLVALQASQSTSSQKVAIRKATSSPVTIATASDYAVVTDLAVPGAVAVTLPQGISGQVFVISDGKADASTNNITISPHAGDTIGKASSLLLKRNGETVALCYNLSDTDWKIVLRGVPPGAILNSDLPVVIPSKGGSGVANNDSSTLAISGNFATTLTVSGATALTLPTSGTLATLANSETLTNKVISGASNTLTVLAASQLSGATPFANGGTGQITQQAGFDALSPATTKADLIVYSGTHNVRQGVGSDGQVLTADSAQTNGVKWATVTTGNSAVVTKTANYTALTTDDIILCNTNAFTVTLPAASNSGKIFRIQKIGSDTNAITISRGGGDTIEGNTSISLTYQYEQVTLAADGSATWYVVARTPFVSLAMDDPTATKMGLKQYLAGTTYNNATSPNFTNANFTTTRGVSVPYQVQDGSWRLRFAVRGTFSGLANNTNFSLGLTGITFKNVANWKQACSVADEGLESGNGPCVAYVSPNSSNLFVLVNSSRNLNSSWTMSGDVELDSKPTYAY